MTDFFLDLLDGLHRWCVAGQSEALPERLIQAQAQLAAQLSEPPTTLEGWRTLWQSPLGEWWPPPLPTNWPSTAHLLSRREATLTVDALMMLEEQRPGAIASALPSAPVSTQSGPSLTSPTIEAVATPAEWNLQDLVTCVIREVQRRERVYPQLVHQKRLEPEQAQAELSQMRAVKSYLLSKLQEGLTPQQQVLF